MDPTKLDVKSRAFSFWREFQAFAFKGNVIDLAVGVVIGTAFGRIIDSLVKNLLMPLVSIILPSEGSYEQWKATINGAEIPYGRFIADLVNFVIVALAVYVFIVRFLGWLTRMREAQEKKDPPLTKEVELLTEIRDLLKRKE